MIIIKMLKRLGKNIEPLSPSGQAIQIIEGSAIGIILARLIFIPLLFG